MSLHHVRQLLDLESIEKSAGFFVLNRDYVKVDSLRALGSMG
jgi:hypothetical protein